MRRRLLVVSVTAILLAAGAFSAHAWLRDHAGSGYPLRFAETAYDFGLQSPHTVLTHTFRFRNVAGRPVGLAHLQTSCGCTSASVSPERLAPGERGRVRVKFTAGDAIGRQKESADITLRDPRGRLFTEHLAIAGYVNARVMLTPPGAFFGNVTQEQLRAGAEVAVYVLDTGGGRMVLRRAVSTSPNIRLRWRDVTPDDARSVGFPGTPGFRLAVRLRRRLPAGRVSGTLYVWVTGAAGALEIPITATVLGDVDARPATFFFGVVEPDSDSVAGLDLIPRRGRSRLRVLAATAAVPWLRVNAEGGSHLVAHLVNPPRGLLKASVRVRYALDGATQVMDVPAFAEVEDGT